MPAAAIVTLALTALTVLVIAGYLIRVAFTLRQASRSLSELISGLDTIADQALPVGAVLDDLNAELTSIQQTLQALGNRSDTTAR